MPINVDGAGSDNMTSDTDTLLSVSVTGTGGRIHAFGGCVTSRTISPPANFTQQTTTNDGSGYRYYYWTADAATVGDGPYTFTVSGTFGSSSVGAIRTSGDTLTGLVTGTAQAGASDNTSEQPSINLPTTNCLAIWTCFTGPGMTATISGSQTERVDTNSASGGSISIYTEIVAASGVPTLPTITTSGFARWLAISVGVSPSAAATILSSTSRAFVPNRGGVPMAAGRFALSRAWGSGGGSGIGYGNRRRRVIIGDAY